MAWCRRLVAGILPWKPGFDPRSVQVRFVMGLVALGQVLLGVLRFPLSVSCQQCSVFILIYMILLPAGQTDEAMEAYRKQCSSVNRVAFDRNVLSM
jgi:hypothetical protein